MALPGGLGTLDELCEALTLIQTRKIQNYPVVLLGVGTGRRSSRCCRKWSATAVSPNDLDLVKVTDDLDEAISHIEALTVGSFGLRRVKQKPKWWLLER